MGIIFDIQKFCVHDGPGIRTSVFLKGCNLCCIWCHNPESMSLRPQLAFEKSLCTGCRSCEMGCKNHVHIWEDGLHRIQDESCDGCDRCVETCGAKALKIYGKEYDISAVMEEIVSDKIYYDSSGGGVTFTGGEPTVQFDFLLDLAAACKKEGISVCVETNGILPVEKWERLVEYVDLFLLDYKATPSGLHKKLTGSSSKRVFETLAYLERMKKPVILRCPLIPGINDSDAHMKEIRRIRNTYTNIHKVEIMAYHATGRKKWESIGICYPLADLESASPEQKKCWEEMVQG